MEDQHIKEFRFREMEAVGAQMLEEVCEVFEKYFQPFKVFQDDPLEAYCLTFIKEKAGNKPLRAYMFGKMFDYLAWYQVDPKLAGSFPDSGLLFKRKLPFVFEVIICIQYLHNHILDEKYDSKPAYHAKICGNLSSGNILKEALQLYIEEDIRPLLASHEQFEMLTRAIRRLFLYVDLGQRLDKNYNCYDHWKKDASHALNNPILFDAVTAACIEECRNQVKTDVVGKEGFVDLYFQRIYLTNVYFFRCMSEVLTALIPSSEAQRDPLIRFSIQYGFMLQIINDYADFAYSEDADEQQFLRPAAKSTKDVFADLYNFNITLPLIYHLYEGGRRNIESYLEGGVKRKKILDQYPLQIKQEIIDSGAIRTCINHTRALSKLASNCFRDDDNPATPFLKNMCDMAFDNKYYKIFK